MRRYRLWTLAFVGLAAIVVVAAATVAAGRHYLHRLEAALPPLPDPSAIPTSTVVVDRDGKLLRPFTTADGRWRLPVTKADVDPRFLDMLIAYEDRRFFEHHGVDWQAMVRAAGQFVLAGGRVISGGSTLTMQVARLLGGSDTRTLDTKLKQIAMALALEKKFSKDQILDLYLTLAPYGGNIEGIRAATLAYFGKEPGRLTVAEAALLVALPQSPESRRPDRDSGVSEARRNDVLDRLAAVRSIDFEAAEAAKSERIPAGRKAFPMLAAHLGAAAVKAHPELPVHKLTISKYLQNSLEMLAADHARSLGPKVSVAIVVADHLTGEIEASVGSAGLFDTARSGFVDMTTAVRSPGSTLKPFIYGLAFEAGLAHPESLIEDRPTAFHGYAPVNFDGFHRGTVTIREALEQSLNVPAVIVLDAVGPARLVARLKRAGANPVLPDLTAPGLAIGLGGVGISLRDLVAAYAALARGGTAVQLRDGVADGPIVPQADAGSPVLDPVADWYVSDILSGTPPPTNGSPGHVAYKTGTSYGYRDAWAMGFDGRHVIGVWVGRPDGAPVPGLSGVVSAAPILFEAFDRMGGKRSPLKARPAGAMVASTSALPKPLRRFRHPNEAVVAENSDPEIAFPLDGVEVDLGIKDGDPGPLAIKVRNGEPPFTFYANGRPIGQSPFDRTESWQPDGSGFVTLSVVDATGRSDRVTVFVE
ncbi:MAG: penicillin-binding protein 1C [Bauldia sp.]